MSNFLRKHGGYIIDYTFCILSIVAVVLYFVRHESYPTIQAAFALVALYSFVVTRRIQYLRNQYIQKLKEHGLEP